MGGVGLLVVEVGNDFARFVRKYRPFFRVTTDLNNHATSKQYYNRSPQQLLTG